MSPCDPNRYPVESWKGLMASEDFGRCYEPFTYIYENPLRGMGQKLPRRFAPLNSLYMTGKKSPLEWIQDIWAPWPLLIICSLIDQPTEGSSILMTTPG